MPTFVRLPTARLAATAALLAAGAGATLAPDGASAASLPSFCSHISASAVSSIVGKTLKESGSAINKTTTCTFTGSGGSVLTGSVILGAETGIPSSISGDYSKEVATVQKAFAKEHVSAKFTSLGGGSFTYSVKVAGFTIEGIEAFKGGTEYDAAVYTNLGLSKLQALLKLAENAG